MQAASGPSFSDWIWLDISDHAKDIVMKMLQKLPENRVSAREALHHNWFHKAPDHHMAEALSAIVRRYTSEATATTCRETLAEPQYSTESVNL